ncbi:MAG: hypothetical protein IJD91_08705 [Clostridia bacterium]|nr:hypothetical protein [Clostridia bacterium]
MSTKIFGNQITMIKMQNVDNKITKKQRKTQRLTFTPLSEEIKEGKILQKIFEAAVLNGLKDNI